MLNVIDEVTSFSLTSEQNHSIVSQSFVNGISFLINDSLENERLASQILIDKEKIVAVQIKPL